MSNSILDLIQPDAVVMFVGVHPDDETLVAPLLAYAADRCREVIMFSLTQGESGWNLHKEDLTRTMAQVRHAEFRAAAEILACTPIMFDYVNGTSKAHPDGLAVLDLEDQAKTRRTAPGGHDASPEAARQRWTSQNGDPVARLAQLFGEKQPDLLITFDPEKGYTGHTEHIALVPIVLEAARQYNRNARKPAELYYFYNPDDNVEDAEIVVSRKLNEAGDKDYLKLSLESKACYQSQYGTRGSERSLKSLTPRTRLCLKRVVL